VGCGSLGSVVVGTASGPGSDGTHGSVVGGSEEALFVSGAHWQGIGRVGRDKGGAVRKDDWVKTSSARRHGRYRG